MIDPKLIRRWAFSQSAQEDGFRADTATIEFAPLDLVTFQANADFFSNASRDDAFDVTVMEGDPPVPVVLFIGNVVSWEYEERYQRGAREGIGILEAQDLRAALLREPADPNLLFPGVDALVSGRVPRSVFSNVLEHVASRTGMTITNDGVEYILSGPAWPRDMTWGQFAAYLMRPLQRVRSVRVDLVRSGINIFNLQKRSLVLGMPDVTIPFAQVTGFRVRRSVPKPEPIPTETMKKVAEHGGRAANEPTDEWGWRHEFTITYEEPPAGAPAFARTPNGSIERWFLHGKLRHEIVTLTVTSSYPGGESKTMVDDKVMLYEVHVAGQHSVGSGPIFVERFYGHDTKHTENGDDKTRQSYRIHYNDLGGIIGSMTITYAREDIGSGSPHVPNFQWIVKEAVPDTQGRVGGGTFASKGRTRTDKTKVIADPTQNSFSAGDAHAAPDQFGNNPFGFHVGPFGGTDSGLGEPLMRESADVAALRAAADAQAAMDLVEASFSLPLRLDVRAGMVIEFSDCPVTPNKFYITSVSGEWEKGRGHAMTLEGETWASPA